MDRYATDAIRNVALVGHGGAGKTSLTEALLYVSGAIDRQGRVEDGNTVSDFDPDEIRRKATIHAALAPCEWNGVKINFLDAPGYPDFLGEVAAALHVTDAALFVVSAQNSGGTDVGFEAALGVRAAGRSGEGHLCQQRWTRNTPTISALWI